MADAPQKYDPVALQALWEYVWMTKKERRLVNKLVREVWGREK